MTEPSKPHIRIGSRQIPLPNGVLGRRIFGFSFVIGGVLGFLPVLGFWMLPVGVAILSVDSPFVRHKWRLALLYVGRRWQKLRQR